MSSAVRPLEHGPFALLGLCLLLAACHEGSPPAATAAPSSLTDTLVYELVNTFGAAVSDSIGEVRRARFVADGSGVVVLDKLPPFLLLFTASGQFRWIGGRRGEGPSELKNPTALAVKGDTVAVTQPGALKTWVLDGDSLRFLRTQPLPSAFVPLDADFLCGDRLLLYGRDNNQFLRNPHNAQSTSPTMDWLFLAEAAPDGSLALLPAWSDERDPSVYANTVLNMKHLHGTVEGAVLLHRADPSAPGRYLEFDCDLRLIRARSEAQLIHGDSVPALDPREFALKWSGGILAVPGGFAAPVHRPTHPRRATSDFLRDTYTRTEIFWSVKGEIVGSVLIARMWRPQDYHPLAGAILSSHEPFPHFIVVPATAFRPPVGKR